MKEREQAPLDQLVGLIRSKWTGTKEWLHDLCVDDDDDSASGTAPSKLAKNLEQEVSSAQQAARDQPAVCPSGYEELDGLSTVSPMPSPPQSGYLCGPTRELSATNEFAAPSEHDAEQKMVAAPAPQHKLIGPPGSDWNQLPVVGIGEGWLPMLQKGEKVEVWSKSKHCWFEGIVLESFAEDTEVDGFKVPSGSYRVHYSENTLKWIRPEQVQELLRPSSKTMPGI